MVVDLSGLGPKVGGGVGVGVGVEGEMGTGAGRGKWMKRSKRPEAIVEERRREGERLEGLVKGLKERAGKARKEEERRRYW